MHYLFDYFFIEFFENINKFNINEKFEKILSQRNFIFYA